MNLPVPNGWEVVEIGTVARVVGGGTPPSKDPTNFVENGGVAWITPADLSGYRQTHISRGKRSLSEKGFASCSAALVPEGSVLFSSRAPVGYVVIASNPVCTNQGFKTFVLADGFDSRFVYYYLRHIKPLAEQRATGTTFKELSAAAASQLPFPVAPTNEQKRIADKLETILERVNACLERLDRVPDILDCFRDSVRAAAVSGHLTDHWRSQNSYQLSGQALIEKVRREYTDYHALRIRKAGLGGRSVGIPVGSPDTRSWRTAEDRAHRTEIPDSWACGFGAELVEPGAEIVYGIVQPGPKLAVGVPYVRGMDIERGQIRIGQLLRTSPQIAERYARAALRGGDVLLGIIRATKVAVVPDALTGANITQGTARFRPSDVIRSKYLALVLEAPSTQQWLHDHYRGIDMPGLNLADVRRVPIPVPPIEEQDEIVRLTDVLLASADRIEARHKAAREQAEELTPALLAKAFRGDLVRQDPGDVPASVLLERARAAHPGLAHPPRRPLATEVRRRVRRRVAAS